MTSSTTSSPPLDLRRNSGGVRRRQFAIGNFRFTFSPRCKDACFAFGSAVVDFFVYLLGPVLICFATAIISGLSYSFFNIMLPMLLHKYKDSSVGNFIVACHVAYVLFILVNVIYNYVYCVMTRNKGPAFDKVVRELADATGFNYPETPQEVEQAKRDYEEKMFFYTHQRQARERRNKNKNNTNSTVTQRQNTATTSSSSDSKSNSSSNNNSTNSSGERVHRWMLLGPDEWGFCHFSNQPKPPRSHYDHVTKCLVLNMDHYCPWMFNTVGYFNYRYFCNFLFYVFFGMGYGAIVALRPFMEMSGDRKLYNEQARFNRSHGYNSAERIHPMVPLPNERTAIAFSFMMCLAVGLAVMCLAGFHLYLTLSAQTTIEFHGNCQKRSRARKRKTKWVNPYDLGRKRNWQQVYGTAHPVRALLPSSREPEFLPLPIAGELGRRHPKSKDSLSLDTEGASGTASQQTNGIAEVV